MKPKRPLTFPSEKMEAWCSVECLMQALDAIVEEDEINLIHHSNRRLQYVSAAHSSVLLEAESR